MTSHHISSLIKKIRYGDRIDPARDWLMMLTFFFVLLTGLVIWNIWAFDTVAKGGTIGTKTSVTVPTISDTSLERIREVFQNRASEEAKYITGVYTYIDPSI